MQNQINSFQIAPKVELKSLDNLFLQLCSNSCNLNCKNCYSKSSTFKKEDDFIPLEKVKETLNYIKNNKLNSIYLTGGEPLLHPDFNKILRMCLKITNTTVITNGTMINDKKARFLKKIDDESNFETIYRISLDSTDEFLNDSYKGRGTFRKAISAILCLIKYEFNPIINVINYNNRKREDIFEEFRMYFSKRGFEMEDINLKVVPFFDKDENIEEEFDNNLEKENIKNLDCYNSRTISAKGVYSCPMLSMDYRARLGSGINDFSKVNYLDCKKCSICIKNNKKVEVNDWM